VNLFIRRTIVVLLLAGVLALVWYAADVLLLAFAGILGAIVLDAGTGWLQEAAGLQRKHSYLIVLFAVIAVFGIAVWQLAPRVILQLGQLVIVIPQALENLRSYLLHYDWGRILVRSSGGISITALIGTVTNVAKRAIYAIGGALVIAVVAAYVAGNPLRYTRGFLLLFPPQNRDSARAVAGEVVYTLRWWLLGQLVPMVVLSIATVIGLSILRIPLVFTLGLLTGVLVFIPYLGAFIAFIITILVTLSDDPSKVPWVVVLFLAIHVTEGYLLTPMVQKRAVYLPPAVAILAQVLMGILLGFFGIAVATPMAAAALVLVKILYLKQAPEHH